MDQYLAMNETEQGEALQYLAKIIKSGIFKINEKSTQGIKDGSCYISSGDVEGIYFPNTIIEYEGERFYRFCCLAKKKDQNGNGATAGVVFALKDDDDEMKSETFKRLKKHLDAYRFYSFDKLFYTDEELNAVNLLKRNINYLKQQNDVLNSVTFKTKKDGGDFTDLLKNVNQDMNGNIKIYCYYEGSGLKFSKSETRRNKEGFEYNIYNDVTVWNTDGFNCVNDIKKAIQKQTESNDQAIKTYTNEIKNIKKYFKIIYDLNKNETLKGISYSLQDELKKAIKLF